MSKGTSILFSKQRTKADMSTIVRLSEPVTHTEQQNAHFLPLTETEKRELAALQAIHIQNKKHENELMRKEKEFQDLREKCTEALQELRVVTEKNDSRTQALLYASDSELTEIVKLKFPDFGFPNQANIKALISRVAQEVQIIFLWTNDKSLESKLKTFFQPLSEDLMVSTVNHGLNELTNNHPGIIVSFPLSEREQVITGLQSSLAVPSIKSNFISFI